jgi:chromate transporter
VAVPDAVRPAARGTAIEIFRIFLKLGLVSFGGPIAHLGYFRDAFVLRRGWIDEAGYAELVALCQFLPGPASSQVGFALGTLRGGGLAGGLAAWCGFTLPSALILLGCALGAHAMAGPLAAGVLHGLKLVAVAVVAQAVFGMARTLTPDRTRAAIAWLAVAATVFIGGALGQILALACGALLGLALCRGETQRPAALDVPISRRQGAGLLVLFAALLLIPPLLAALTHGQDLALFAAFYRSGALVFGGGHVVLPLLQAAVVAPGWVGMPAFLDGYGLAQAVPGPLFAFAAYLGAIAGGATGALIALVGIFLPGLLLVSGMLPFWGDIGRHKAAGAAMRGANAAVVGILGAALYDPVWTSAVLGPRDFALALAGFLLLTLGRTPPWAIVAGFALIGAFCRVA